MKREWLAVATVALSMTASVGCGGSGGGSAPPPATTWSISGKVLGAATAGVTVTLSGAGSGSTTTDASGNYAFAGLPNGVYAVAPTLSGYSFSPVGASVTVNGANVTGQDFTATAVPNTWTISGTVSGAVTAGVTVTLSGANTGSTTTDAVGNYSFAGLANGGYTVTPSLAGYAFSPTSASVTVNGGDMSGQNFTATVVPSSWTISGTVSGAASAGVTVTLGGANTGTTTTDTSGNYAFTGLTDGSYTVTPSMTGYAFTPASLAVTVSGANVPGQNFTSAAVANAWTISGTVSGATIAGVTVTLGGANTGSTTTDANGDYAFAGLTDGSYTVTPSLLGYTFTPADRTVTVSGASVTGQNFSATAQPLRIDTMSLPAGTVGQAYTATITAVGGVAPLTFSATGTPTWLTLSPDGHLSGTPTSAATATFTVTVTDDTGATATRTFAVVTS